MDDQTQSHRDVRLTRESMGITLLALLLSIGVSVGLGIRAAWWIRVLLGAAVTIGLALAVAGLSRQGALKRLARWITGGP
jgi:hypothetical protein